EIGGGGGGGGSGGGNGESSPSDDGESPPSSDDEMTEPPPDESYPADPYENYRGYVDQNGVPAPPPDAWEGYTARDDADYAEMLRSAPSRSGDVESAWEGYSGESPAYDSEISDEFSGDLVIPAEAIVEDDAAFLLDPSA
ncbi:MAG: hypothetical protein Q7S02_06465, partial [bacterium]|nr:hypothetical protein [bacterium]